MIIRDKIEELNLYFVEQDMPNCTFYEVYKGTEKLFQSRNNFEVALKAWCETIQNYMDKVA